MRSNEAKDVARKAEQYGGTVHYRTISNWVRHGQADMEAGQPSTFFHTKLPNGLVLKQLSTQG